MGVETMETEEGAVSVCVCGKSAEKLWENMNLTALSEKRTSLHNACYICRDM